jgi:2-C-methyl-D-erythritol 4-phosphate cytidylyltransferase
MDGVDKIFAPLGGQPLLCYAIHRFNRSESVDTIVVVVRRDQVSATEELVHSRGWSKVEAVVPGGERRQDSVAMGMAALPQVEYVAVHDGARPFVSDMLVEHCIRAAVATGAAIPAVPPTDTMKRVGPAAMVETIDRASLWAAQTPQVFSRELLARCLRFADLHHLHVTDESSIAEILGVCVSIVPGERWNFKVTTPEDLELAEWVLTRNRSLET